MDDPFVRQTSAEGAGRLRDMGVFRIAMVLGALWALPFAAAAFSGNPEKPLLVDDFEKPGALDPQKWKTTYGKPSSTSEGFLISAPSRVSRFRRDAPEMIAGRSEASGQDAAPKREHLVPYRSDVRGRFRALIRFQQLAERTDTCRFRLALRLGIHSPALPCALTLSRSR